MLCGHTDASGRCLRIAQGLAALRGLSGILLSARGRTHKRLGEDDQGLAVDEIAQAVSAEDDDMGGTW